MTLHTFADGSIGPANHPSPFDAAWRVKPNSNCTIAPFVSASPRGTPNDRAHGPGARFNLRRGSGRGSSLHGESLINLAG